MKKHIALLVSILSTLVVGFQTVIAHAAGITIGSPILISALPTGDPATTNSTDTTTSLNGRYVIFGSRSANLVPNTTLPTNINQLYLYDKQAHTMELVSKSTLGAPDDGGVQTSIPASISNDGRYVLFTSSASNLTDSQTGNTPRVYLRDRTAGTTTLISSPDLSVATTGPDALSGDGNTIVYSEGTSFSDEPQKPISVVYNRTTNTTTPLATNADEPVVSNNGKYIGYVGPATDQSNAGKTRAEYRYNIATSQSAAFTGLVSDFASGPVFNTDGSAAAYYDAIQTTNPSASHLNYSLYLANTTTAQVQSLFPDAMVNVGDTFFAQVSLSFASNQRFVSFYTSAPGSANIRIMDTTTGESVVAVPTLGFKSISAKLNNNASQLAFTSIDYGAGSSKLQAYTEPVNTGQLILDAPIVTATSPTNTPVINWSAIDGADHYNVYRDGSLVSSPSGVSFTDSSATQGTHNYYVTAVTSDSTESDPSNTVAILVDKTPPTISNPTMSNHLILFGGTVQLSATTSDTLSGVASGEYYIDNDPGVGHGSSLAYSNGKITGTAAINNLSIGLHTLYMRSKDNAGNWSITVSTAFIFV